MRKLKYFIFLIILLSPLKVNALISLDCIGGVAPGKTTTCSIKSDINITSFKATISTGKVNFSITPVTGFLDQTTGSNVHLTSISGGKNVATINLSVPSSFNDKSFTVTLTNINYLKIGSTNETPQYGSRSETIQVVLPTTTTTTKKTTTTTKAGTTTKPTTSTTKKTTTTTKAGTTTTTTTKAPTVTSVYLKSLAIEGQEIQFSKFILEYDLTVLYEIQSLKITAEADSTDTSVTIEEEKAANLVVGENIININLADKDGKTNTYTVKVKRLNEGELLKELSSDATLQSIDLGTYSIDFSPTQINYTLEIKSGITSLPINAVPTDENATWKVEGNANLKTDSEIQIIVTAEDGTTNTYHIFITVKNALADYYVYIALGSVVLLSLIVIIIKTSGKKKKTGGKPKEIGKISPDPTPVKPVTPIPVPTPTPAQAPEVEVLDL